MKKLSEKLFVSGQIQTADLEAIAQAGVKTVINNRPDGEMPGQPSGDSIRIAAEALGLNYHAIPVAGGFSMDQVEAVREILASDETPVLAFCASGTRSTILWALSQGGTTETDNIISTAAEAGYNLAPYRQMIDSVAG